MMILMKRFALVLLFTIFSIRAICQQISPDQFNREGTKITRQSMLALGAWGGANLLYSGIASASATGSNKYFHQMNLIWGGVNFTLGAAALTFTKYKEGLDFGQSLKKQLGIEKLFLFNTGLDVAYVVGGFYFKEKAKNSSCQYDRYHGYGNSIILQGAALFLYDGAMYFIHHNHGKSLYKSNDNFSIGFGYDQLYCIVKF